MCFLFHGSNTKVYSKVSDTYLLNEYLQIPLSIVYLLILGVKHHGN